MPVLTCSFLLFIFKLCLLFRPHLWEEELYTQMGFFVQTILADRYIHRREMWVVSLKNWSSVKFKKIFFAVSFFFRRVIEDWSFVWTRDSWHDFVHFSINFLQIEIISLKTVFQNYTSCHKMHQFCVPYRLKAIKKTNSDLIGKFTIKKNSKSIWELFFTKFFNSFCFLSHLETSHFSYKSSVDDKPHLQSNEAQWTNKISFSRNCSQFFWLRLWVFVMLNKISFLRIY